MLIILGWFGGSHHFVSLWRPDGVQKRKDDNDGDADDDVGAVARGRREG